MSGKRAKRLRKLTYANRKSGMVDGYFKHPDNPSQVLRDPLRAAYQAAKKMVK